MYGTGATNYVRCELAFRYEGNGRRCSAWTTRGGSAPLPQKIQSQRMLEQVIRKLKDLWRGKLRSVDNASSAGEDTVLVKCAVILESVGGEREEMLYDMASDPLDSALAARWPDVSPLILRMTGLANFMADTIATLQEKGEIEADARDSDMFTFPVIPSPFVYVELPDERVGAESGDDSDMDTRPDDFAAVEPIPLAEEVECCIICSEELVGGLAAMPCCGKMLHTRCFANAIANTIGTEMGNMREKCIFCRSEVCDKVKMDFRAAEQRDNLFDDANAARRSLSAAGEENERLEEQLRVLTIDHQVAKFSADKRHITIKKLRKALKGKKSLQRQFIKIRIEQQDAHKRTQAKMYEMSFVRCAHPGCQHSPFKLDSTRRSAAYEAHLLSAHYAAMSVSTGTASRSIGSAHVEISRSVLKCQAAVRGHNARKLSLWRLWNLLCGEDVSGNW